MSDKTSMSVWSYLLSSEARMTIIVPILIYNLVFWGVRAGAALIVTACYSALLELFSKRSGSVHYRFDFGFWQHSLPLPAWLHPVWN